MEVFGEEWSRHVSKLSEEWHNCVAPDDTVIVAGDTDWGLHFEDARETLALLDGWPGSKILVRGNHDYWWSSKATNKVRRDLPGSLRALHNNAYQVEGFNVCGTKGPPVPGAAEWTDTDNKILNRELQRLRLSLEARAQDLPTIVALHYPPFYRGNESSPYRDVLDECEVALCVYGHLHANASAIGPTGRAGHTEYRIASADRLRFVPLLLAKDGKLDGEGLECAQQGQQRCGEGR